MLGGSLDRIRNVLEGMRARLWLIPAVMTAAMVVFARLLVRAEGDLFPPDIDAWWYFAGEPDTARHLLSTLLSGMITMTSLVISITMVVLSVAAAQLGPRLIWNFIRDWQIQIIIGLFFSAIVFILVVMRSIGAEMVPSVAVTSASALVGLCLFALLFHVHKLARSIVADTVIDAVADDLNGAIQSMPDRSDGEPSVRGTPTGDHRTIVSVGRSGFVHLVDYRRLRRIAEKRDLFITVRFRPGHFLLIEGRHLEIRHPGELPEDCIEEIRKAVHVGRQRTPTQDVEYSVRQLVEIAVRALSPGVNDPFTAIGAVYRLGAAIELLANRRLSGRVLLVDESGRLRVTGEAVTFAGVVDAAFNQIRQAATNDPSVLICLVEVLGRLGVVARTPCQSQSLARHLEMVARAADRSFQDPDDRSDFEHARRYAARRIRASARRSGKVLKKSDEEEPESNDVLGTAPAD